MSDARLAGFFAGVLSQLGAPQSANSVEILTHWSLYEIGGASLDGRWNPLNTTENAQGATIYNTAGVKNYPSEAVGIDATARTIENGYYPAVLAALRADAPLATWIESAAIHAEINTWGTHGFAAFLESQTPPPPEDPDAMTPDVAEGLARLTALALGHREFSPADLAVAIQEILTKGFTPWLVAAADQAPEFVADRQQDYARDHAPAPAAPSAAEAEPVNPPPTATVDTPPPPPPPTTSWSPS